MGWNAMIQKKSPYAIKIIFYARPEKPLQNKFRFTSERSEPMLSKVQFPIKTYNVADSKYQNIC